MGVQLICDSCKKPVLSAVPLIMSQNPTAIGGTICLVCLRKRMDRLETPEESSE